jgi:hypothetical protein
LLIDASNDSEVKDMQICRDAYVKVFEELTPYFTENEWKIIDRLEDKCI